MRSMDLTRKESLNEAIRMLAERPKPPGDFTEDQKKTFETIINVRSVEEWKGIDAEFAAELVRVLSDLKEQRGHLELEGTVIVNRFGDPAMNPRAVVVNNLRLAVLRLEARLQLGGARDESAEGTKTKRKAERHMEAIEDAADESGGLVPTLKSMAPRSGEDDLLPRFGPTAVRQ